LVDRVYRVDLFNAAVRQLGLPPLEPSRKPFSLFDGELFDPNNPLLYVRNAPIGHPVRVEEIVLNSVPLEAAS
jgi:nitrate/nitrite transport system ATP-binding protein